MSNYEPLPEGIRLAWTQALRSGEYDQTQEALCRKYPKEDGGVNAEGNAIDIPAGYCCLGVLCEVASLRQSKPDADGDAGFSYHGKYLSRGDLTADLRDRFGLDEDAERQLIRMNDEGNEGFEAIADWIDANLAGESNE